MISVADTDASAGALLRTEQLVKRYKQRTVVNGVSIHVGAGEIVGLLGPNGAGKTTTFNMVVGVVRPGFELTPNPDEVAEIFETPFGFLMDPANHERRYYDMPDGARRWFYAMTYEERMIWGATAGMLRALYDRLYGAAVA